MEWVLILTACLNVIAIAWVTGGWRRRMPIRKQTNWINGVSVILAARNEQLNLKQNLPGLFNQSYFAPTEVIVVLDRCEDDSLGVVQEIQSNLKEGLLKIVLVDELPEGWTGKKYAINQGIAAAKHDYLLFTDADCQVEHEWVESMTRGFAAHFDLVLGVGPLLKRRGFLNLIQRFETWMTAILYLGMAGNGRPYMGVGRSIGYTKQLFSKANGFEAHKGSLSGDDDLLVNAVAGKAKVALVNADGCRAFSAAPETWREWIRQKMRHHSAAPAYSMSSKLILVFWHGLHAIFYLSLMLSLLFGTNPVWVLAIWGGRSVAAGLLWASIPWPNRTDLLFLSPLLDLIYLVYLITVGLAGMVAPPKWKGK